MFEIHTTSEGKSMMICEMEDTHLYNTIKFHLRRLILVVEKARSAKPLDRYEQRLYGYRQVTPEQAADLTKQVAQKLAPYVLEATLRGQLPLEITEMLQKGFGRKSRMAPPPDVAMLTSGDVVSIGDIDDFDWMRDPDEGDR